MHTARISSGELVGLAPAWSRASCVMAEVRAHQAVVFLFDEAVVVLLVGAGARELGSREELSPDSNQRTVEELCPIVGVNFEHWEWQAGANAPHGDPVKLDELCCGRYRFWVWVSCASNVNRLDEYGAACAWWWRD